MIVNKFRPDEYIEMVGESEVSQHAAMLNKVNEDELLKIQQMQAKKEQDQSSSSVSSNWQETDKIKKVA